MKNEVPNEFRGETHSILEDEEWSTQRIPKQNPSNSQRWRMKYPKYSEEKPVRFLKIKNEVSKESRGEARLIPKDEE